MGRRDAGPQVRVWARQAEESQGAPEGWGTALVAVPQPSGEWARMPGRGDLAEGSNLAPTTKRLQSHTE